MGPQQQEGGLIVTLGKPTTTGGRRGEVGDEVMGEEGRMRMGRKRRWREKRFV